MPKKILIVDDEEDMQIYLETLFQKAGFKTDTAVNGEDAREKLSANPPDLITLDIMMPKKSGLHFFKFIREKKQTRNIPVAVVSGVTAHRDFFQDQPDIGPTIFVDKPIEPATFLKQIKELLADR